MRLGLSIGSILAGMVAGSQLSSAQQPAGVTRRSANVVATSSAAPAADGSSAFVLEALGGSVGALLGVAVVGLASNCGVDDLACGFLTVGAGGVVAAVGATVGTTLVARRTGSRRSVLGAAAGAVVGTGVGLGLHYLFNHDSDRNLGDAVVVPLFVIAQGTLAAGSRLFGAAEGMR